MTQNKDNSEPTIFDDPSFELDFSSQDNGQPDIEGTLPDEWKDRSRKDETLTPDELKVPFDKRKQSPRIAVSLASNISTPVQSMDTLQEMFLSSDRASERLDLKRDVLRVQGNKDIKEGYKPVRLTNQEIKLCYALSYLLTIESESQQLKIAIDESEGSNPDPLFVSLDINATDISKIMTGESRLRYRNKVGELLKSLSQKTQIFKGQGKVNGKNRTYIYTFPLLISRGFVEEEITDKNGNITNNFIGMKADLLRPFFENVRKKYIPIGPSIFTSWIDSDLFANLFSKLCVLWANSRFGFYKAKEEVLQKYDNTRLASKIQDIEEEIQKRKRESIVKKLNFETIMNLSEGDYNSNRDKVYRFKKELEKCIDVFIKYGIITSESHIIPEKKQVVFVFNMEFKGESSSKLIESKKQKKK